MAATSPLLDVFTNSPFKIYTLSSSKDKEIVRYVGYTTDIKERLRCHIKDCKKLQNHRDKWINKVLRDDFTLVCTEIDIADSVENLKKKEIYYIKLYKSFGAKLTNSTTGGEGLHGYKQTEEQKRLNGLRKRKKIYCFIAATEELYKVYNSRKEMTEELNLTPSAVHYTLKRKYITTKGYVFSYDGVFPEMRVKKYGCNKGMKFWNKKSHPQSRPVILYNDKEEIEFKCKKHAFQYLKVGSLKFNDCIKNNLMCNGFYIKSK